MYTTLNRIQRHEPCKEGWVTLLKHLGKTKPDDELLSLLTILDSNGFEHTLWCFRAVDGFEKEKLLLGITFAKEVEHLMPDDSKKALDVFERCVNGMATQEEFEMARAAVHADWAAARAARDDAARAAAWAAGAAAWAAGAAARAADAAYAAYAAGAAARAADAADAAYAAGAAARAADAADAAWSAANAASNIRSTLRAKQETQLRQLLEKTCTNVTIENSKH